MLHVVDETTKTSREDSLSKKINTIENSAHIHVLFHISSISPF